MLTDVTAIRFFALYTPLYTLKEVLGVTRVTTCHGAEVD